MNKKTYLLISVLALAIFVRVWGLDYGLPYFFVGDERALVYGALKMGELKTLIPAWQPEEFDIMNYKYNYLMSYVYLIFLVPFVLIHYLIGSFSSLTELADYYILNPSSIWLLARVANLLIGVATVCLVYLIGKKMGNFWTGLLAALFLTFSFLHIQLSHFTRPWVPHLFFTCLIMLFSFYVYKFNQRKYYLFAGLASGLAFGVTPAGPISMSIFFLAHFLSKGRNFVEKLKDKNLMIALLVFVCLVAFFTFTNPKSFSALAFGSGSLMSAKSVLGYFGFLGSHIKALFFYEPVILILSLLGIAFLSFKSRKIFLIALSWPLFYLSALYFINYVDFSEEVLQARYLLLILPWLAILAGLTAYHLTLKVAPPIKIIMVVLLLVFPLTAALQYDNLLSQKDTRVLAKEWVEQNISSGAKILSAWDSINPVPNKEAILYQKEIDEGSLRVADEVLLALDDEDYPQPSYEILRWAYLDREKSLPDKDYQYFLIAFWQENELLEEERAIIEKAQLIREFKQNQAKEAVDINSDFFRPLSVFFSLKRPGPTVQIYKL